MLVDYEGTFSYLENNVFTMDTIVRISSLSNPEKKIIGLWNGGSEVDFQLRNVHLFDDKTFPYGFPVDICMNYGGDLLVEYITADIQDQIKLTEKLAQSLKD